MRYALWIVQGLLAALFLFASGVKLIMPIEELTRQIPLTGPTPLAATGPARLISSPVGRPGGPNSCRCRRQVYITILFDIDTRPTPAQPA